VRIEVADSGPGPGGTPIDAQSTGVGLANIRDRLSQAYGGSHRFETRQNDRGGFSVILEIPFETGENPE
jgi:signal transduction histidine kinase